MNDIFEFWKYIKDIEKLISEPNIISVVGVLKKYSKEYSEIKDKDKIYHEYKKI